MYEQISIPGLGIDQKTKSNKNKYIVHYYKGYVHYYDYIDAYSEKQACFLVQKAHNFKCKVTDVYKI